jgi:hypothetical protein
MYKQDRLAPFFIDDSNSDKYEEVADFFISWTLRCAQYQGECEQSKKVCQYAKRVLALFLSKKPNELENSIITSVKTWKQWDTIDILLEVKISGDDIVYVTAIEDKYCAKLTSEQLQKYKQVLSNYSKKEKTQIKYFVIRLEDIKNIEADKKLCDLFDFSFIDWKTLKEVLGKDATPTGNALFDEFWFNWAQDVIV